MNEQLKKLLEDTLSESLEPDYQQKQKLVRVIELLVEQRDKCISSSHLFCNEFEDVQAMNEYDAKLIATLEGK